MSRFMRLFSGRWNVPHQDQSGSRPASHERQRSTLICPVQFLDGTQFSFELPKRAYGSVLYQKVFNYMDLIETDYFGLQFTDEQGINRWLEVNKTIKKQVLRLDHTAIKGSSPMFQLRVKFYSSQPSNLKEEITRYQVFLQVKQDVLSGKLPCPFDAAVELAALVLQSDLGDFDPSEHTLKMISQFRFVPNQTAQFEVAAFEKFKNCKGMSPGLAEMTYLNKARWLELYGVDFHVVQGRDGNDYTLGLVPAGILVFEKLQKIGLFYWPKITQLQFKKKKIILEVVESDDKGMEQEHTFIFRCSSERACKNLWKCAVEHHGFFRLSGPSKPVGIKHSFLRMGSRFRYSGNTELQSLTSVRARKSVSFERKQSQRVSRDKHSTFTCQPSKEHKRVKTAKNDPGTYAEFPSGNDVDGSQGNTLIKRAPYHGLLDRPGSSKRGNNEHSEENEVSRCNQQQQQRIDQDPSHRKENLKDSSPVPYSLVNQESNTRNRTKSTESQRLRSQTQPFTPANTAIDFPTAVMSLQKKSSIKTESSKSPVPIDNQTSTGVNSIRITDTLKRETSNFNRRNDQRFQSTNMGVGPHGNTDITSKRPRKTFSASNMMDVQPPDNQGHQRTRIEWRKASANKATSPPPTNQNAVPSQNNFKENHKTREMYPLQNSFHSSLQKKTKPYPSSTSPHHYQDRTHTRNNATSRYPGIPNVAFQDQTSHRIPLTSSSSHNQHLNYSRIPIQQAVTRETVRSPVNQNHSHHYNQSSTRRQLNDRHSPQQNGSYGFHVINSSGQLVAKELSTTRKVVRRDERSKSVVILTTEV